MSRAQFQKKEVVVGDRVGVRLKSLREQSGITLEELAHKTKINRSYLAFLEDCNFSALNLSAVYQKNFIKKFVETLGADPRPFLDQFAHEEMVVADAPSLVRSYRTHRFQLSDIPNTIRVGVLTLAVGLLLSYLGFHVHNILKPPSLTVINPTDGYISEENAISITGSSEPETKIMINEVVIKNDGIGNFAETITLTPGINTLVIKAENKHGRQSHETRHVIYKQTDSLSRK